MGDVTQAFDLKVGETILYSKFGIGVTDLTLQGELHILIREDDVIGTMPRSGATAEDVPHLKPAADRVLLKVSPRQPPSPPSQGATSVPAHAVHLVWDSRMRLRTSLLSRERHTPCLDRGDCHRLLLDCGRAFQMVDEAACTRGACPACERPQGCSAGMKRGG